MASDDLQAFMNEVMGLNAGYAGMGGASAGIIGAGSTHDQLIHNLRGHALAFATEYAKTSPDKDQLLDLAAQLEGAFNSLQLVSAISQERLTQLLAELEKLVPTVDTE